MNEVLLLAGYDGEKGDITLSFLEEQFIQMEKSEMKSDFCMLIQSLAELYKYCELDRIILGYEPAEDDDMKIMEISQGQITNFNENINQSRVIQALHQVANELKKGANELKKGARDIA